MSEQTLGTRIEDVAEQDRLIDYVSTVLAGKRAQELRGAPRLIDMSGSADERRMYGGLFVAALLHYHADPDVDHAPVDAETTDRALLRLGFNIFQELDMHRDGGGKVPPIMHAKIHEFSPGSDPRIDLGHTLVAGLHRRQLAAEFIATEAMLAMQYRFGRGQPIAA